MVPLLLVLLLRFPIFLSCRACVRNEYFFTYFPHPFICQRRFSNEKVGTRKSFKSWILGGLSFFDFQLFTNKTSLANKWMSFSSSNLALGIWNCVYMGCEYELECDNHMKNSTPLWLPLVTLKVNVISNRWSSDRPYLSSLTPYNFTFIVYLDQNQSIRIDSTIQE